MLSETGISCFLKQFYTAVFNQEVVQFACSSEQNLLLSIRYALKWVSCTMYYFKIGKLLVVCLKLHAYNRSVVFFSSPDLALLWACQLYGSQFVQRLPVRPSVCSDFYICKSIMNMVWQLIVKCFHILLYLKWCTFYSATFFHAYITTICDLTLLPHGYSNMNSLLKLPSRQKRIPEDMCKYIEKFVLKIFSSSTTLQSVMLLYRQPDIYVKFTSQIYFKL